MKEVILKDEPTTSHNITGVVTHQKGPESRNVFRSFYSHAMQVLFTCKNGTYSFFLANDIITKEGWNDGRKQSLYNMCGKTRI